MFLHSCLSALLPFCGVIPPQKGDREISIHGHWCIMLRDQLNQTETLPSPKGALRLLRTYFSPPPLRVGWFGPFPTDAASPTSRRITGSTPIAKMSGKCRFACKVTKKGIPTETFPDMGIGGAREYGARGNSGRLTEPGSPESVRAKTLQLYARKHCSNCPS
jgi:hypothetical protein